MATASTKSAPTPKPEERGTREIPAPIVDYGGHCMVLNYRRESKGVPREDCWEIGIVKGTRWQNAFGGYSWHYDVLTARRDGRSDVSLTVNDEGIKAYN